LPVSSVSRYLDALAKLNRYEPIVRWITGKQWDNQDRVKEFCETLETTNNTLRDVYVLRWLVSAVASQFMPDHTFSYRGILTLYSRQNLGKTSWFEALVPDKLQKYILTDGYLDPADKDTVISVGSHWLVEYGDVDSMTTGTMSRFKSYQTKKTDIYRAPFARCPEKHPRKNVALATVDKAKFLTDSDNTRFWCLEATGINYRHKIDMQQLFAQIYQEYYSKGYSWFLNAEEEAMQSTNNETFEQVDPIKEKIMHVFCPDTVRDQQYTSTRVLELIGIQNPSKSLATSTAATLRKLGYKKIGEKKGYAMPVPKLLANHPIH
jgi:putative DNA primase/helicase